MIQRHFLAGISASGGAVHHVEVRRNGDAPEYDGLVLANDLCERWQLGPEWVAFGERHTWMPYRGSRNVW